MLCFLESALFEERRGDDRVSEGVSSDFVGVHLGEDVENRKESMAVGEKEEEGVDGFQGGAKTPFEKVF